MHGSFLTFIPLDWSGKLMPSLLTYVEKHLEKICPPATGDGNP